MRRVKTKQWIKIAADIENKIVSYLEKVTSLVGFEIEIYFKDYPQTGLKKKKDWIFIYASTTVVVAGSESRF